MEQSHTFASTEGLVDRLLAAEEAEHLGLGLGGRRGGGVGEGGLDLGGGRGRRRGARPLVVVGVRGRGGVLAADVELVGELLHQGLVLGARAAFRVRLLRHVRNPRAAPGDTGKAEERAMQRKGREEKWGRSGLISVLGFLYRRGRV
jgi:hypothetical protein